MNPMPYSVKSLALSAVAAEVPEFYVLTIDREANRLIKEGQDIIKLNLGKSEVPMPKYVVDEMVNKLHDERRREIVDSQGLFDLRAEIARDYAECCSVSVNPEHIFINNGTSPFFLSLFLLIANSGDEIMLPLPYYPPYLANAKIVKAPAQFYPIRDGRIDREVFRAAFHPGKTKAVLLNSPGNPLGNIHSADDLRSVLEIVNGQAYVISDEIYDGFVYGEPLTSILQVYNSARDKVIVINGFSKIHHMYTRRLGYAIVPPELAPALLRFQQHTVVCVDPVTQFAGLVSLKNKSDLINNQIKDEMSEYARRLSACKQVLVDTKARVIPPAGSFYMCLDVSRYLSARHPSSLALAEALLRETHIAVTPGEDFGKNDFFRVSLTSSRVIEGIERMRNFFLSV